MPFAVPTSFISFPLGTFWSPGGFLKCCKGSESGRCSRHSWTWRILLFYKSSCSLQLLFSLKHIRGIRRDRKIASHRLKLRKLLVGPVSRPGHGVPIDRVQLTRLFIHFVTSSRLSRRALNVSACLLLRWMDEKAAQPGVHSAHETMKL